MVMLSLVVFTACKDDYTDFNGIINRGEKSGYVPKGIEFDYTSLGDPAEAFAYDDNDYVENMTVSYTVEVRFDGNIMSSPPAFRS